MATKKEAKSPIAALLKSLFPKKYDITTTPTPKKAVTYLPQKTTLIRPGPKIFWSKMPAHKPLFFKKSDNSPKCKIKYPTK